MCDPAGFDLLAYYKTESWTSWAEEIRQKDSGCKSLSAFILDLHKPLVTDAKICSALLQMTGIFSILLYLSDFHSLCLILCVLLVCIWYSLSQRLLYPLCSELIHGVLRYPVVEPLNHFWQIKRTESCITGRMSKKCGVQWKSKTSFFVFYSLNRKPKQHIFMSWFIFLFL